jgi:fucose 4-O-acetylase-like acetyltransferase
MASGGRDLGLDAVRGIALLSMFVAHFAPVEGPGKVLTLSEHLTAFLFALLVGAGAELGRPSPHRWRASQVRATVLVALGLALMQLTTSIVVILVWLGVLTLVATWLSHLPGWGVALVGTVAAVTAPRLMTWGRDYLVEGGVDRVTAGALELAVAHPLYRVVGLLLPACAGILVARYVRADRARLLVAVAAAPVALGLFALDKTGTALLEPYSGTAQELVFNTAVCLVVSTVTWVLAPRLAAVGTVLAAAGAMTLTIYCLQVVGDWAYFRAGGVDDDRWVVLAAAAIGSLLLAAVWMPVARATGWRGPLEGPVDLLARGRAPRRGVSA